MRHRVITVTADRPTPDFLPESLLGMCGDLRFERTTWGRLVPEELSRSGARLVLALAVSETDASLRLFRWLMNHRISSPVLTILPADPDQDLLEAAADASDDFLISPIRTEEFHRRALRLLRRPASELEIVRDHLVEEMALASLVGEAPAFSEQVERIPACAANDFPVLITGETGTGKEMFARAIHHIGARRGFAFIPLDCGAVPDHLFENELFGHARGAFTDAHKDQKGLIALAAGGTLLLDEVDSLSLAAQTKLLRLLQERTYRPLGSDHFLRADVKVIAATNGDLEALVARKQFRSDLFYRLNVLRLKLPPLRERRRDVALLAQHFLRTECPGGRKSFSPGALESLCSYDWPGNVRELLNTVQHAIVFSGSAQIQVSDIPLPERPGRDAGARTFREAREQSIHEFERSFIQELLERHSGNVTRAAREAGKDRRVFGRLVKKYCLQKTSKAAGQGG